MDVCIKVYASPDNYFPRQNPGSLYSVNFTGNPQSRIPHMHLTNKDACIQFPSLLTKNQINLKKVINKSNTIHGADDHRKMITLLDKNKLLYFTYRRPGEKNLGVVRDITVLVFANAIQRDVEANPRGTPNVQKRQEWFQESVTSDVGKTTKHRTMKKIFDIKFLRAITIRIEPPKV